MKLHVLLILGSLLTAFPLAAGQARTWTAADGRTLEAELVSIEEDGIIVRRTNDGRSLPLKLEMLSEQDQEFIRSLKEAEANEANDLEAEAKRAEGLKSGPFAELITGKFVYSKSDDGMPFQFYGPENAKASQRYPLVLALHGGGNRGGDGEWPVGATGEVWTEGDFAEENPCFVVAPRCPENLNWQSAPGDAAAELVKILIANLPIDVNRVYVTGGSLGGGGSWYQIEHYQNLYAGALILCNAGKGTTVSAVKDFPIWQFHGEKDPDHPVEDARSMSKAMEDAGATQYQYTELEGEGHIIHPTVYGNPDALNWLFDQARNKAP